MARTLVPGATTGTAPPGRHQGAPGATTDRDRQDMTQHQDQTDRADQGAQHRGLDIVAAIGLLATWIDADAENAPTTARPWDITQQLFC